MRRGAVLGMAIALVATAACSGDDTASTTTAPATTAAPVATGAPTPETTAAPEPEVTEPTAEQVAAVEALLSGVAPGCDPLDMRHCMLPFPSNHFLVDDPATDTGRRVAFPEGSAPANADGTRVELTEWNRNDGFSPNTPILTYVPGIDAEASNLPPWTDLEASLADETPVVLIDADTGERVPLWAELDAKADDDADRLLAIHPAVPLAEGHTYVVGLRNLAGGDGELLEFDTPEALRADPVDHLGAWRRMEQGD